jgi:hypothetical protein
VTALLLILDHMLQCKLQLTPDAQNTVAMGGISLVSESEDTTLAGVGTVDNGKKSCLDVNSKGNSPFMKILGKRFRKTNVVIKGEIASFPPKPGMLLEDK